MTATTANPQEQRVTLIHGGPISDALALAVERCVQALGVSITWEHVDAGMRAVERGQGAMPPEVVASIRRTGVCLKPLLRTPVGGYASPNVQLRKELGVFAGVRPIRSIAGVPSRYGQLDILLVREMTEGTYAGIEHEIVPGVVQTIKVMTAEKCQRLVEFAFQLAEERGRKRVTLVHKANIMKQSDGMFTRIGRAVAEKHPDIEYKEIIVDNCAMQMVARPEQFDVLVADNLFGDILTDVGAGLCGSPMLVAGENVADGARVFEATHHLAPSTRHLSADLEKGEVVHASPLALLVPTLELLRFLGHGQARERLLRAIERVLAEKTHLTPDLGGQADTAAMTEAIVGAIA